MKKLILTIITMFAAMCVHAISINEIFSKYGKRPDCQHIILKGKELKSQIDSCETQQEKDILKKLKRLEILAFEYDDDMYEQLTEDIGNLKNYELTSSVTHNNRNEDTDSMMQESMFKTFVNDIINPSAKITIYSKKTNDDNLKNPLIVINYFNCIFLVYMEGTLEPGEPDDIFKFSYTTNYEADSPDEGYSVRAVPAYENIVIAFDGKINETLTTIEDAENYLTQHNLHPISNQVLTDKDEISEAFPGVEADMVINYIFSENKTPEKQGDGSCGQ